MRYTTHFADLVLYTPKGEVAADPLTCVPYKFRNNELILGTPQSTTDTLNPEVLAKVYKTDLSGKKITDSGVNLLELAGLGCLLDPSKHRLFYEAPPINLPHTGTYTNGVRFKVLSGTATYNGKTYYQGEKFWVKGASQQITGNGQIALTAEPVECSLDLSAEFRNKELIVGDEPFSYWHWNKPGGIVPRENPDESEPDTWYWTR